jgi:hypothetical protein
MEALLRYLLGLIIILVSGYIVHANASSAYTSCSSSENPSYSSYVGTITAAESRATAWFYAGKHGRREHRLNVLLVEKKENEEEDDLRVVRRDFASGHVVVSFLFAQGLEHFLSIGNEFLRFNQHSAGIASDRYLVFRVFRI